jgi:hypothetical protein
MKKNTKECYVPPEIIISVGLVPGSLVCASAGVLGDRVDYGNPVEKDW